MENNATLDNNYLGERGPQLLSPNAAYQNFTKHKRNYTNKNLDLVFDTQYSTYRGLNNKSPEVRIEPIIQSPSKQKKLKKELKTITRMFGKLKVSNIPSRRDIKAAVRRRIKR